MTQPKITFKEWVRHPTTAMMIIAVSAAWGLILTVVTMAKDRNVDCKEQVSYLRDQMALDRDRITKLEQQLDAYTTTIMALKGANTRLADSLIKTQ